MRLLKPLFDRIDGNKKPNTTQTTDEIYAITLQSINPTIISENRKNLPIKDCKIFVLEDHEGIRNHMAKLLDTVGVHRDNIFFAKNVEEAQELRWDNHFDLAMLDYSIKGSDLTWLDFLIRLLQEKYSDGNNRPVIIGNSWWFHYGSWWQSLFFKNEFIQNHLNKESPDRKEIAEKLTWSMDNMNIDLVFDQ